MKNVNTDILRVLLSVKQSVSDDIHCGMIYIIKSIEQDASGLKLYTCSSINNEDIKIICVACKTDVRDVELEIKPDILGATGKIISISQSYAVGDIVVVLHCDEDFRANLKNAIQGKQIKKATNSIKHTLTYGVIVGLIWKGVNNG